LQLGQSFLLKFLLQLLIHFVFTILFIKVTLNTILILIRQFINLILVLLYFFFV